MHFQKQRGSTPNPAYSLFNVEIANLLVVALISSLASFLNFQASQRTKWSWGRFFAHISASLVSAFLTTTIAMEMGVTSTRIIISIAAVAGWAGVSGVNWVIYAFKMRALMFAGLTKAAERERLESQERDERRPSYRDHATDDAEDVTPRVPARRKHAVIEKEDENVPKD